MLFEKVLAVASCVIIASASAFADDLGNLAQKTQNPISDVISVPFQFNVTPNTGLGNHSQYLLNIQPVAPLSVAQDWNLIVRPIIPVLSQPFGTNQRDTGLGDIILQSYFTPKNPGSIIWGIGPVGQFPTRTDVTLGQGMWGAGVGGVVLKIDGSWLYGALVNHVWSVGDPSPTRFEFSTTTIQPFINYNFKGGWALGISSTTTVNYDALRGQQWTVPIGAMLTKTFVVDKQPMQLGAGVFYNVVRPDGVGEWQFRVQYTLIFPTGK